MLMFTVYVSPTRWHTVNITDRQPALVIKGHHDMKLMLVFVMTEYSMLCYVAQDITFMKGQDHKLEL